MSNLYLTGLETILINKHTNFINVGERTNVTGSIKFSNLIKADKFDKALDVATEQIENGAQVIDINFDDALLDSKDCMVKFLNLLQAEPNIASVPIMIDSSKFEVILAGLKCVQGKCIVNSISLKEGEKAFIDQAKEYKKYGVAIVVMAFDEQGQADTLDRRIEVCARSFDILTNKLDYKEQDIIFDPNIFAIGSGIKEHDNYAIDFIQSVKKLKQLFPNCMISGGVSNLSFAFRGNNVIREAMHSIFLYHAIKAGMGMGIVNAGKLPIYDDIDPRLKQLCEDIIFNKREGVTEELIEYGSKAKNTNKLVSVKKDEWRKNSLEQKISYSLVHGIDTYIIDDMKEALDQYDSPVNIIEKPMMAGMDKVGELFGSGKMFLPQVVKSARVMKKAVAYLEPFIKQEKSNVNVHKKKILLATVKGDVHDIGKNIVGVVLSCNGYEIIDLGVMVPCEKIIAESKNNNVDAIGLSGLITPSLDEMVYVAQSLSSNKLNIPLLIGGATTSKTHTALKILPEYPKKTIHVLDASKSVSVCSKIFASSGKNTFLEDQEKEYLALADNYKNKNREKNLLSIKDARLNRYTIDWENEAPFKPNSLEKYIDTDVELSILRNYIDWKPFFIAWEMKGNYPDIFNHKQYGKEALKLYEEANKMLDKIIEEKWLNAKFVCDIFPAGSIGDDVYLSTEKRYTKDQDFVQLHFLRQQMKKAQGQSNLSLSDFIKPCNSESYENYLDDHIGAFVVTTGLNMEKKIIEFENHKDDYSSILFKILADRLAEASAEFLHMKVRKDIWGYAGQELLTNEELIQEKYTGIRPAPGYPACPDHTEKYKLFDLLDATNVTGVTLTESLAMHPAASVCGWYIASPYSKYFTVGKINQSQIQDYSLRKKTNIKTINKWLNPIIA